MHKLYRFSIHRIKLNLDFRWVLDGWLVLSKWKLEILNFGFSMVIIVISGLIPLYVFQLRSNDHCTEWWEFVQWTTSGLSLFDQYFVGIHRERVCLHL